MDEDAELAAIRARLRDDIARAAQAPAAPPAPAHPVDVDDAMFDAFVRTHSIVVVDVWAPWCAPCRIIGPIVEQLATELQGKVVFAKLNADENPRVMSAFGVQGLPTLLIFQDGRLADRVVGAVPKPVLAGHIQRLLQRRAGAPGPRR